MPVNKEHTSPRRFGLIGYPLSHSFSPGWFARKFESLGIAARYDAFPLDNIAQLPELLLQTPGLEGLNVTIPYKEAVLPYLHALHPAAAAIGAVNCIRIDHGKLTGYNTDTIGFRDSLLPLLQPHHTAALILGKGGAALAVAYTLQQLGISYRYVSSSGRAGTLGYEDLSPEMLAEVSLIINTTPLGMYPHTDSFPPLPYEALGKQHLLYDLIYNPEETTFLKLGQANGATTQNGMQMLVLQAEASWRIWNNE